MRPQLWHNNQGRMRNEEVNRERCQSKEQPQPHACGSGGQKRSNRRVQNVVCGTTSSNYCRLMLHPSPLATAAHSEQCSTARPSPHLEGGCEVGIRVITLTAALLCISLRSLQHHIVT